MPLEEDGGEDEHAPGWGEVNLGETYRKVIRLFSV